MCHGVERGGVGETKKRSKHPSQGGEVASPEDVGGQQRP